MDYRKFLDDNNPLLTAESFPFLKKMCQSRKFFFLLLFIAVACFMFAILYMVFEDKKTVNKILLARESTLNTAITRLENKNDILEAEILLLKNEVKSLSRKKDQRKLAKISKYLADTEVSGRGVMLRIEDNNSDYAPAQEEETVVHNTDLLKIVNFLWEHGARAISINDERIVQNSHISCVGPTILVNKKRINSPFVIKAVGEKFNKNAIQNSVIVLSLKLRGIEFEITESDEILIPAGKYTTFTE